MPRKGSRNNKQATKTKVADQTCKSANQKRKSDCFPLQEMDQNNNSTKRHCSMQVQDKWLPLTYSGPITPEPMDEIDGGRLFLQSPICMAKFDGFRTRNDFVRVPTPRRSPLPKVDWAESREVWANMLRKEAMHVRDPDMLNRHTTLQPRMRGILLDWLIEVSEVYRLHRETYYLAMDFIDRFLSAENDVQKQQLQQIGITALFIAAKAEEIYPPKLAEFAYVTDGACSEDSILTMELRMLQSLKWDLTPMTANSWLNLYLQLVNAHMYQGQVITDFHMPHFSAHSFIQIIRLLDLCTLDIGSLNFPYSVLTTAAVYHLAAEPTDALVISGYELADIAACVHWMTPFTQTIAELGLVEVHYFPNIAPCDAHNIQTHVVDTDLLEHAQIRQQQLCMQQQATVLQDIGNRSSPELSTLGVLTPPQSGKKHVDVTS